MLGGTRYDEEDNVPTATHHEILADVRGRATCEVPDAGALLGLSRSSAYRAAARGEIPTIRLGRRLVVPVAKLLEMLGEGRTNDAA